MIRVAARAKGAALLLITDQLAPPDGQAARSFGSGAVSEAEGAWRLADGTLAGSTLTMDRALGVAEASGAMTRHEAVRAATLAPARLLGIEAERGTLRVGARADLVRLRPDGRVRECWVAGERAFARD
jgi:N-acetylglucosamine-6-phosphate deacetylase